MIHLVVYESYIYFNTIGDTMRLEKEKGCLHVQATFISSIFL